jgi:murein DD-endopeptidase MepM/ murein hydrolase activator NlpD
MFIHAPRIFTIISFAVVIALSASVAPTPALASSSHDDFVLTHFPHIDVTSHFANDFGNARSGGRHHQGTDIFGEKHSPVLAVADGFVTAIRKGGTSGYYVRIEHRDGWESWYMHLNNDDPGTDDGRGGPALAYAPDLEVGMYVASGTIIGYVGDSGNAEGSSPHTHFELHHNGRVVNPYPYLAAAHDRWMRYLDLRDEVQ